MTDGQPEPAMTRVALLELKDEQRLVQEGFELLDEKRILLAAEIRRQLQRLGALRDTFESAERAARAALGAALFCHGLDELSVYPPLPLDDHALTIAPKRLLGIALIEAQVVDPVEAVDPDAPPVNPTPEARRCALAYRQLLAPAIELAACGVNLRRLTREYVRTERRARAIENILLPQIETTLRRIDEQLENIDQEEIARVRRQSMSRSREESPA